MMSFLEWILTQEDFRTGTRDYKKRRLGAITGAAKMARRGSGIAKAINPANLSKPDLSNPYQGSTAKITSEPGFRIDRRPDSKVAPKQNYFQSIGQWSDFDFF